MEPNLPFKGSPVVEKFTTSLPIVFDCYFETGVFHQQEKTRVNRVYSLVDTNCYCRLYIVSMQYNLTRKRSLLFGGICGLLVSMHRI